MGSWKSLYQDMFTKLPDLENFNVKLIRKELMQG